MTFAGYVTVQKYVLATVKPLTATAWNAAGKNNINQMKGINLFAVVGVLSFIVAAFFLDTMGILIFEFKFYYFYYYTNVPQRFTCSYTGGLDEYVLRCSIIKIENNFS